MDKNSGHSWDVSTDFAAQRLAWTTPPAESNPEGANQGGPASASTKLAPNEPSAATAAMIQASDESELNAIVGPGTAFHGTLSFSGHVRIEGEFAGQILGGRLLVIAEGARIQGEIRAQRVVILGGNVKADIFAAQGIELYVPAQVAGDLQAPEIHMDRGVKFQGTCDLTEPDPL